MRHCYLLLALAIPTLSIHADPPVPKAPAIRLPTIPAPMPPPSPVPLAVSTLAADQVYVIDSDVPCIVLASPEGIVSLAEESGPVKIRGRFVDGNRTVESRTYCGKCIYTVEAVGSGHVELLIVPSGAAKQDVLRRGLDVGMRSPPPRPDPMPNPSPSKDRLWGFVIVEETAESVAARGALLTDTALAALVKSQGYRWRIVDQEVVNADGQPPADVLPCLTAAKGQVLPQVFAIDVHGKIVSQAALTSAANLVQMLKNAATSRE